MKLSRGKVVGPGGRVGQHWTPEWLAEAFVAWAGIRRGTRVLDAGSGRGALSLAAAQRCAIVRAVELDEVLAERSRRRLEPLGVTIVTRDFLAPLDHRQIVIETAQPYEVAISNPPWEGDYPERFLERMLMLAPRACAILPLNFLCGVQRGAFWGNVAVRKLRPLPRRPKFGVATSGMRDVMLIEVVSRYAPRTADATDTVELGVGE